MSTYKVAKKHIFLHDLFNEQSVPEEPKKELLDKDVQMGFDITLTKHKGQVTITDNWLLGHY